jgi:branched-chain amino acid transport system substrate-binding protein
MVPNTQVRGPASRWRKASIVVLAVATAAGLAACSSSSKKTGGGSGSGASDSSSTGGVSVKLTPFYPGRKASGTPVKIGLINNEGSSAAAEPQVGDAAVAAAKYANDELGGIAGRPIEVDRCPENEDVSSATACANKMVEDNVAAVVVGTSGFGETMVPIITKAGIPYISALGTSAAEQSNPDAFMWTGGFIANLKGWAGYAKEQGWKKVTAYVVDVPSATTGVKTVGDPLFKADGVSLKLAPVPEGIADATPQVTAGLSSKPDGVLVIADDAVCTSVLKALAVADPKIPRMANGSCYSSTVVSAVGDAINGLKIFGFSSINSEDAEAQLYQAVMKQYSPKTNTTGFTVNGYQGMLGLVRALSGVTGDITPATIKAGIKAPRTSRCPPGTASSSPATAPQPRH